MSLLQTFDAVIARFAKRRSFDRCDAVANVSANDFTTREGGFISTFNFSGSMKFIAEGDIAEFSKKIENVLKDLFRAEGHIVSFYVDRTSEHANELVRQTYNNSKKTLDSLKITSPIPAARGKKLKQILLPFTITVTITTTLGALTERERKVALESHFDGLTDIPRFKPDQTLFAAINEVLSKHVAFCSAFESQLNKDCAMDRISCEETLFKAHDALYRLSARGHKRKFQLLPKAFSIRNSRIDKENGFSAPSIAEQIINEDLHPIADDPTLVRVGDRVFAPLYMPHSVIDPTPLNDLLSLVGNTPFRMAVHIYTGAGAIKKTGNVLLSRAKNTKVFDDNNKDIYNAARFFLSQLKIGHTGVNVSFSFTTWGSDKKSARNNREFLAAALGAWGGGSVHYEKGDPVDTLLSTVPLFGTASTSPPVHPWLLKDLLPLLPFSVSASLFDTCDLCFALPSGQPYPFEFGSDKMLSYSMLVAALSGSGKSSFLTNILNSLLFRGGEAGVFPPIGVIDNGLAQTFWSNTIRSILPKSLHYLIQCETPTHSEEHAMNFLDLPLGLSRSPVSHDLFATGYLLNLLLEPGTKESPASLTNFCSTLIRETYRKFETVEARIYHPGESVIDDALALIGFEYSDSEPTTFYQIRDMLFDKGYIEAAFVAQSYAVPTLYDLIKVANDSENIKQNYSSKTYFGEPAIQFVSSTINNIAEQFPALAHRSRINWQGSKIRIINLQVAAPKASKDDPVAQKTSSLFYGIAWNALFGEYFMRAKEVEEVCPPRYINYQMERLSALESTLKTAVVDEYQRASYLPAINNNVIQIEREGRARKIFGCFISQGLEPDFPIEIIEQAASIVVLGLPDKPIVKATYRKHLFYSENQELAISKHLATTFHPTFGSSCLIYFEYKGGSVLQLAYVPAPPEEVWQMTTDNIERALVDQVEEFVPAHEAISYLAKKFGYSDAGYIKQFSVKKQITIQDACVVIAKEVLSSD